jgi:type II secretory ATPase GspE/PulE/Tfp pilus assembly ATPase PilB-like protein
MLAHLNHQHVNIMTLEDPVEYPHMLMRQTSVSEANKVDFVSGIRAILRQDPDIILVGEVRDESTAAMAIRAAMTGHLVMTTLHTNNAIAAFARLQDLGISPQMMAGSVVGIIAQRLLRRLCPNCKVVSTSETEECSLVFGDQSEEVQFYQAVGCEQCRMSGYRGRLAIMEILDMHPELDEMLIRQSSKLELQQKARSYGYTTLAEEGLQLVRLGETSLQELRRVVDVSACFQKAAS